MAELLCDSSITLKKLKTKHLILFKLEPCLMVSWLIWSPCYTMVDAWKIALSVSQECDQPQCALETRQSEMEPYLCKTTGYQNKLLAATVQMATCILRILWHVRLQHRL